MAVQAVAVRVRDAELADLAAIVQTLAAAGSGTSLSDWVFAGCHSGVPDPHGVLVEAVTRVVAASVVRVATVDEQIIGAAVWNSEPAVDPPVPDHLAADCLHGCVERLRRLAALTWGRRPGDPHHQLTFIGVRPEFRRQGLASFLLIGYHAFLHAHQLGGHAVTDDGPLRELLLRHGYSDIGPALLLPDGVPAWSMWRPPGPPE